MTTEGQNTTNEVVENQVPDTAAPISSDSQENQSVENTAKDEGETEIEEVDYEGLSKEELLDALKTLRRESDISRATKGIREIRKAYDAIFNEERKAALDRFIADDGKKDDFEYRLDAVSKDFEELHKAYSKEIRSYFQEKESQQEGNLHQKKKLLDELRSIVDGEENEQSFPKVRDIQTKWKETGPVPHREARELHANYGALLDRFYNNRSIFFELKELDRKKNFDAKDLLIVEAVGLMSFEPVSAALKRLNELHEEYRNIGPVPRDDQEEQWQRFKKASDALYEKRAAVAEEFKAELEKNFEAKSILVDKVEALKDFSGDRITEWREKSDELKKLQDEWKSIGPLPKDRNKGLTRSFWNAGKVFFTNKSEFFKVIDSERDANMAKKVALCEEVEAMKENEDFRETTEKIKKLQERWKDVGPVSRKESDKIYARFRAACDHFFNRRRDDFKETEKEYKDNYKTKKEICDKIEALDGTELEQFKQLLADFDGAGFVPRDKKKVVSDRFTEATNAFFEKSELSGDEVVKLKLDVELGTLKGHPNAETIIHKKKSRIRGQINEIENDAATISRNMEFFARSSSASQIKAEAEKSIAELQSKVVDLKAQLKLLNAFKG